MGAIKRKGSENLAKSSAIAVGESNLGQAPIEVHATISVPMPLSVKISNKTA